MAYKLNPFTKKLDYYEPANAINSIGRISALSLIYCEEFTGDGADTTFTLTGVLENAIYEKGTWLLSQISSTLPCDITTDTDGPIYNSSNIFTRTRIEVTNLNPLNGEVTLSVAPLLLAKFRVWYWYTLKPKDILSFYYRSEYVSKMESSLAVSDIISAQYVAVDTTSFDTILFSSDDDVQTALETIDKHTHPEVPVYNYMPGGWS